MPIAALALDPHPRGFLLTLVFVDGRTIEAVIDRERMYALAVETVKMLAVMPLAPPQ